MKSIFSRSLLAMAPMISTIFFSCERPVPESMVPKAEEVVVVNSFISPQDTVIRVVLSKSVGMGNINTRDLMIKDAEVVISDGANKTMLAYDNNEHLYSVNAMQYPIKEGTTYFLNIALANGKVLKSQCTVPLGKAHEIEFTIDSVENTHSFPVSYELFYKVAFKDLPQEKNYYRLLMNTEYYNNWWNQDLGYTYQSDFRTPFDHGLVDDQGKQGQMLGPFRSDAFYIYSSAQNEKKFILYLLTVDRDYFAYYRSLKYYDGGPFTEPYHIYSNIEGGIGLFASYQVYFEELY